MDNGLRWYTVMMLNPGGRAAFYAWVQASGKAEARNRAVEAYRGRYVAAEFSRGVVRQDCEPTTGDRVVAS